MTAAMVISLGQSIDEQLDLIQIHAMPFIQTTLGRSLVNMLMEAIF